MIADAAHRSEKYEEEEAVKAFDRRKRAETTKEKRSREKTKIFLNCPVANDSRGERLQAALAESEHFMAFYKIQLFCMAHAMSPCGVKRRFMKTDMSPRVSILPNDRFLSSRWSLPLVKLHEL